MTSQSYALVLQSKKRTTEEIKTEHLKYIAEITKDLAGPQGEELTFEQQEWLSFRMMSPFPDPYKPYAEIVMPLKWKEVAI